MKRTTAVISLCAALLVAVGACGEDPTFQVVFDIDETFLGPHADQAITVAVVRTSDGVVLDEQTGTVSATEDPEDPEDPKDPAFSYTSLDLLEFQEVYEVHYWIDSNFGGGTVGVCDPPANDHQWSVAIPAVAGDVTIHESHDAATLGDVCATFTP